jgi:hypothetical protein
MKDHQGAAGAPYSSAPLGITPEVLVLFAKHVPRGFTSRSVAEHLILPMVQQHSCERLVDVPALIPRKYVGPASVYVAHAWDAPFHQLVADLLRYLGSRPESDAGIPVSVTSAPNICMWACMHDRIQCMHEGMHALGHPIHA